jgi:DNA-binding transcriptional LysR family regulator
MKTSMRFDLVDLRLFLFVVEAANITHGAARTGMALASASERIRLMEESLGAPLLERHRRGVRATPAGAALVHHAQLVVQQLERMRGELSEYADGFRGRVRLFANTTASAEFLPAALAAFLSQHPQIDIDLEERSSRDIVRAVAGNLAEIGHRRGRGQSRQRTSNLSVCRRPARADRAARSCGEPSAGDRVSRCPCL